MSKWIEVLAQWLKRVVTQPREELDRWQAAARFTYDLGRFGARQLRQDRATQMAAALAFRTLFGLLPVLVVATVLVKAGGFADNYLDPLNRLFEFWGLDKIQIIPPVEVAGPATTLDVWLLDRVREAEQVNVAAIGWVGMAVTLYAAIGLVVTVENCFNLIYRASEGRSWTYRVPLYWFALTISPVSIVLSAMADTRFQSWMGGLHAGGWLTSAVGVLWSLFAIWLVMLVVYMLFPNTKVNFRPAMIGAFVAALLLEIGKRTMGVYLQNALSLSQLYGSLGLIPLFMFWVYLMWLAVLFGLQVSSTLQHLRGRRLAEMESQRLQSGLLDPSVVVAVMQAIANRFLHGKPSRIDQLAADCHLPEPLVERLLGELVNAGEIHRLAEPEAAVTLSRPPDQIPIERLLELAFQMTEYQPDEPTTATLQKRLRDVQRQAAAGMHLAALVS